MGTYKQKDKTRESQTENLHRDKGTLERTNQTLYLGQSLISLYNYDALLYNAYKCFNHETGHRQAGQGWQEEALHHSTDKPIMARFSTK